MAWLQAACVVLALIGLIDMGRIVFVISRRTAGDPVRVAEVEDAGAEVAGYIATYLLPFLTVAEPSPRDLVAYALFLLVIGVVYVRSEMTQINPTLYLLGYTVARVTTDQGWSGHFVTPRRVVVGQAVTVVPLNTAVRVVSRGANAA